MVARPPGFVRTLLGDVPASARSSLDEDHRAANRFMLGILAGHWALSSLVVSWAHGFFLMGFVGGGLIVGLAALGMRVAAGDVYSRMLMGACLMLFSALFIQQGLGRIEWHFHVFASMAFLTRYKDLRPLLAAVVTIAVHHLAANYCQQFGVSLLGTPVILFDYGTGLDIVLLHAAFVIAEAAVLGYIIYGQIDAFWARTQREAEDEEALATLRRVIHDGELSVRIASSNPQAETLNGLLAILTKSDAVRSAFEHAQAAMVLVDDAGRVQDGNDAAHRLFATLSADYRANGIELDLRAREQHDLTDLFCTSADSHDLSAPFVTTLELGDHFLEVTSNPVVGRDGAVRGAILEWSDLSSERRIESEVAGMVAAASEGDLSRRVSLDGSTGFYATLGNGINTLVGVAEALVSDCSRVLSALADGDLTDSIETRYEGQFGRLTRDLNTTIAYLTDAVGSLQNNAGEVDRCAGELVTRNDGLSARMRKLADNLENTATAMEELTTTVSANAENAVEANRLTRDARERAEHGGSVVTQAIAAMEEIKRSSTRVTEITSVINEIAFQTNLLALNASVEAARAGDHGRGFAVVASEVRNLAARSATAASEINGLISESVARVAEGGRLVNESGATLEAIVSSVQHASEVVAQIADASQQQSQGLALANDSVGEMDELTRSNATLVATAAADSEALRQQARSLQALVDAFRLPDGATAPDRTPVTDPDDRPVAVTAI